MSLRHLRQKCYYFQAVLLRRSPSGFRNLHSSRKQHRAHSASALPDDKIISSYSDKCTNPHSSYGRRPSQRPWNQPNTRLMSSYSSVSKISIQKSLERYQLDNPECNVPPSIITKVGRNLHLLPNHPLNTIKTSIEEYWKSLDPSVMTVDNLPPIVSTNANFDSLRIGTEHVSRSKSDTYYLDKDTVLRTHTSAHQVHLLTEGTNSFLVSGDVYRRDEIDSSHYPVFHQMEGVKIISDDEFIANGALSTEDRMNFAKEDLKQGLEGMVRHIFGDVEMRWGEDYFPFTHPSFELEIYFENEWLEVLGCGVIHPQILANSKRSPSTIGWAFGLGLERLAMILFSIPDIRLFWTADERFHSQFKSGNINKFRPYSKYPPCFKDVSFWILDNDGRKKSFHANDLMEIVRDVAGDIVEKVHLVDEFVHPKTNLKSNCFRVSYRSMDRSLTDEEVNNLQEMVRFRMAKELNIELR